MANPKTYTVEDIERYHRGEMTAAEMHHLEKAALDDPMLADMVEGYRHTATASADLLLLQQKLQQRLVVPERKAGTIYRMQWMKIAAAVLFFAGAGWLVLQTFTGREEVSTIARAKDSVENRSVATTATDSIASVQRLAPLQANDSVQKTDNTTAALETAPAKKNKGRSSSSKTIRSKEKETTETAQGYASAATLLQAQKENVDATSGLTAQADKAPATLPHDTVRNLNITLQPLAAPMEEVVIAKRKLSPPAANRRSILDTLKPENGWEAFDDYVAENIQSPEELAETPADSREVELSFNVDKGGKPRNITITKSLCGRCDTEAIRLLKDGPKWKGKKGKVKIVFPNNR